MESPPPLFPAFFRKENKMEKADVKKEQYDSTLTYASGGKKGTVRVRKRLDFAEFGAAAEVAVNALYTGGMYKPYLKQYALAATVVQFYTDYDGSLEPDKFMQLVEQEDFYPQLRKLIDESQYFQLEDTVEEMVDYRNSAAPLAEFVREILENAVTDAVSSMQKEKKTESEPQK